MLRHLYIILWVFVSTENVYSINCYTSDFNSFLQGNVKNLSFELQNCDDYNNIVKEVGKKLQTPENVTLHCYTVEVSRDVVIKGCVQKGGCRSLIDTVKDIIQQFGITSTDGKLQCVECNQNKCNINDISHKKTSILAPLTARRSETSLNCYHCLEPCEISKARTKICGENIGKSLRVVCSSQRFKNSTRRDVAIRKCQIVPKIVEPFCPEDSYCNFCNTDLCNNEEVVVDKCAETLSTRNLRQQSLHYSQFWKKVLIMLKSVVVHSKVQAYLDF